MTDTNKKAREASKKRILLKNFSKAWNPKQEQIQEKDLRGGIGFSLWTFILQHSDDLGNESLDEVNEKINKHGVELNSFQKWLEWRLR